MSQNGLTASSIMQTGEQEMAEFEMKFAEKVDEDAKILALKSIMSETQAYSGEDLSTLMRTCAQLSSTSWVTKCASVPPISTTNMVQTLSTGDQGEQGEDEEMKNEVTQDEIFAMVQQFRKGEVKGKGKGKKEVCWNYAQELDRRWCMEESKSQQGRQRCRQG